MWSPRGDKDADWTENFIRAIRSKPALYNRNLKNFADKGLSALLWNEIAEETVDNWNEMSEEQKIIKTKELQHRWRNLRTCFKRELNKQKDVNCSKKRRKYIYFEQLLFLLPNLDENETTNETNTSVIYMDLSENEEDHPEEINNDVPDGNSRASSRAEKREKKNSFEELLIQTLKEEKSGEIDEDKLFLMSLIPTFKRMSDAQKIDVKMEFLGAIKRIMHRT